MTETPDEDCRLANSCGRWSSTPITSQHEAFANSCSTSSNSIGRILYAETAKHLRRIPRRLRRRESALMADLTCLLSLCSSSLGRFCRWL
ncbi:hypothetical protein BDW66DRAFT_123632 [Aspergillus desertorum]